MNFSKLELDRFRWRCRRGMLELDLLLLPFFEEVFHDLTDQQQHAFIRLLEQEDPDLIQWFSLKGQAGNSEMQAMVDMILERVQPTSYL